MRVAPGEGRPYSGSERLRLLDDFEGDVACRNNQNRGGRWSGGRIMSWITCHIEQQLRFGLYGCEWEALPAAEKLADISNYFE